VLWTREAGAWLVLIWWMAAVEDVHGQKKGPQNSFEIAAAKGLLRIHGRTTLLMQLQLVHTP
jgi:hypothetical protein